MRADQPVVSAASWIVSPSILASSLANPDTVVSRLSRTYGLPPRPAGAWFDPRMPTGAEAIVEALEAEGVDVCFGLPGVHNLALWEAVRRSGIRLVGVRHEQAAAYAADGYARATGRLGVALTTTGPGAANTLGAVGEAWASRSPVLVVATDIPSTLRREGVYRGVLHETDGQAEMFRPVVKGVHLGAGAAAFAIADALATP